ncbi:hypothetical protein ACGC1H_007696 [Rhizoctonia solani]
MHHLPTLGSAQCAKGMTAWALLLLVHHPRVINTDRAQRYSISQLSSIMKLSGLLALGSLLSSLGVLAVPIAEFDAKVAAGFRLIQTSDDKAPFWATEDEKLELLRKDIGYFDLTETYHLEEDLKAKKVKAVVERATYPAISKQTAVKALLPSLSTTNMNSYLSKLTAFNNRYYKATTGLDASNYIYDTLSSVRSPH